jgi:pimeloyl-ACP methyl ester carboxylesterase
MDVLSSQLAPHRADRVTLAGTYGPIAALRAAGTGTGEPRPAVLCVPGYTGSKEDFAPLIDPVADAGLDVIAIDLPGQQESPGPDDEDAYLPDQLGTVVAELVGKLAAEGQPLLLLGHSYGGLVARAAVLAGAPVAGLTLLCSGPAELPQGGWRMALEFGDQAFREKGLSYAHQLWQAFDAHNRGWDGLPAELIDFLNARFLRSVPAALLGMARGLLSEPDRTGDLARVLTARAAPGLVICGEHDVAWAIATQQDMADRLEADFAVIPDAKHSPAVENPAALLGVLLTTWRTWLAR